jgi:hypothetical protein
MIESVEHPNPGGSPRKLIWPLLRIKAGKDPEGVR